MSLKEKLKKYLDELLRESTSELETAMSGAEITVFDGRHFIRGRDAHVWLNGRASRVTQMSLELAAMIDEADKEAQRETLAKARAAKLEKQSAPKKRGRPKKQK